VLKIVFGSPVWVGKPDDNPEEKALPLPAELQGTLVHEGPADYSYGAGGQPLPRETRSGAKLTGRKEGGGGYVWERGGCLCV
jgi:hypothetical protein